MSVKRGPLHIAAQLKAAREHAKRQQDLARNHDSEGDRCGAVDAKAEVEAADSQESAEEREQRQAEEAKRDREQEKQERAQATSFNQSLGILALKQLARVKVDERVLRILASST